MQANEEILTFSYEASAVVIAHHLGCRGRGVDSSHQGQKPGEGDQGLHHNSKLDLTDPHDA